MKDNQRKGCVGCCDTGREREADRKDKNTNWNLVKRDKRRDDM